MKIKPMRDAAFYFILQATPTIATKNHKHPIQNHMNEGLAINLVLWYSRE